MLPQHPAFKKPRKVSLGKTIGRYAKCQSSRKEINVGNIVLRIKNFVVLLYGSNKTVINTIFICAKSTCSNSMPKWTNARKVTEDNIATETEIGDEQKETI